LPDSSPLFLARRLEFKRAGPEGILALGEGESYALEGASAALVSDLLRGSKWDEAFERVALAHGQETAVFAAKHLAANRILLAKSYGGGREEASFAEVLGRQMRRAQIALRGIGPVDLDALGRNLEANGHQLSVTEAQLLIVATSDYLLPQLDELNERRAPWLIVKPTGRRIWLGPVFVPGHGVCRPCLTHWLRLHRWRQAREGSTEEPSPASLPSTLGIAAGLVATAVSEILAGHDPAKLNATLLTFDTISFELERHPIASLPGCPRCKPQALPQLAALASGITGILERLETVPSPTGTSHLALAHVCVPLPIADCRLPQPPFSVGGQGRSAAEARERCLFEGVERYSATFRGDERLVEGRNRPSEIALAELLHFSDRQYSERELWNAHPGDARGIPEPCKTAQVLRWSTIQSLVDQSTACAPAGFVYLWYPFQGEPRYNYANTNGCAAGRSLEQAQLHALLELIERDALAIWWYNRLHRPGLDWRGWRDAELDSIGSSLKQDGRDLLLLDLTHDLGVPVVAAVAPDRLGRRIYFGAAARTCPLEAARSAASELLQFWFWGERGRSSLDKSVWLDKSSLEEQSYLLPSSLVAPQEPRSMPVEQRLEQVVSSLQVHGLDSYFADLTRPEIGIPVVRAFVPGLRHHGPRLAPGRLYDVSVRLGWLDRPKAEHEMNPEPCVL
jgi:bacteriocin biosynthesis cyclodehydratase domain-containing protein